MKPARAVPLSSNFSKTYFTLRVFLGVLALAMAPAVTLGAWLADGVALQPSLSAYYHTVGRDLFVGILVAAGIGLIAYKGFSLLEDWLLNLGGVLACCIAAFPMSSENAGVCIGTAHTIPRSSALANLLTSALPVHSETVHYATAVAFYLVLGAVMITCAHETLHLVPLARRRVLLTAYPTLGLLFVASMVLAYALFPSSGDPERDCQGHRVIAVEIAGLLAFAAFWFLKTWECWKYEVDRKVGDRRRPWAVRPPLEPAPTNEPSPERHEQEPLRRRYLDLWRAD